MAIADNGQPAVDFEILKRQVAALGSVASSGQCRIITKYENTYYAD
jgi:hypothetical protein